MATSRSCPFGSFLCRAKRV
ncbi:DNA-directed RNA polymerase subunit beta' [Crocosphaera chwakensis CCY0110]|uniref:DNA-directed RNA polymerase subunit beta n=1 Tax=Crocosphaera chwakensis CCY0110 TaxID=391612 RepID=A3IJJ5_9CHRO|nr:DNA-directed RNA polymerase subunit beta' [Crocosphaera chwakensis CCY0110]